MPRFDLPSKQPDGTTPNWVEVASPDTLLAETLFAIHAAVRISSGAGGETSYSPRAMEDDSVNAFLGKAITGWSFPAPIPAQNGVVAADVAIGRVMTGKDWSWLKNQVRPLIDELEGAEREDDPKPPLSS
jgi:hypothetical protein